MEMFQEGKMSQMQHCFAKANVFLTMQKEKVWLRKINFIHLSGGAAITSERLAGLF